MVQKHVGIMGGTFDPIHVGHLMISEKAYEQLHLDKVLFIPSGNPPHKRKRSGRATDSQRIEMVSLAIQENHHFELCLEEMQIHGYSFTYLTVEMLKSIHPDTEFYFIMGADSLLDFENWREPERICRAVKLAVAVRDYIQAEKLQATVQHLREKFQADITLIDSPNIEISSEKLREWVVESKSLRYFTPDSVYTYIKDHNIYKQLDFK
ncbi:MAG: nicotinate-nucleotide adenylyltransferase [Lachnospiraceae bacterium]